MSNVNTIALVEMGLAAVVSTWCAYQSAIWGGIQTIRFNEAAAARVDSSRSEITGTQQLQVDIATFIAWVQALQAEEGPDFSGAKAPYEPNPRRASGFLFNRFRRDFQPAARAWLSTRPLVNADAPPTPFVMKDYPRQLFDRAAALSERAEQRGLEARRANLTSDMYMLTTVIAALVVFFSGMGSQLTLKRNGSILVVLASVMLVVCVGILTRLPVSWS